jgi:hypothetical protein
MPKDKDRYIAELFDIITETASETSQRLRDREFVKRQTLRIESQVLKLKAELDI